MEVGFDVGSMATDDGSCCIIEVMGRAAGWISAGAVLAKRGQEDNPPHIILLPEIALDEEKFPAQGEERRREAPLLHRDRRRGAQEQGGRGDRGRQVPPRRLRPRGPGRFGGRAQEDRRRKLNLKTRTVKLGYAQRAAARFAELTDSQEEAVARGNAATKRRGSKGRAA